jgi:hypothetical protein
MDGHATVSFDHHQANCLWQRGIEATGILNAATSDDEAHNENPT